MELSVIKIISKESKELKRIKIGIAQLTVYESEKFNHNGIYSSYESSPNAFYNIEIGQENYTLLTVTGDFSCSCPKCQRIYDKMIEMIKHCDETIDNLAEVTETFKRLPQVEE